MLEKASAALLVLNDACIAATSVITSRYERLCQQLSEEAHAANGNQARTSHSANAGNARADAAAFKATGWREKSEGNDN